MFSSSPNYTKLKTNLRLVINRLKLLEKKKTETTQKSRKEIADFIQAGKYERAKIRVENIIREDYLVEAMEVVEMYCDLVVTRFGLVTQMKDLDDGIAEAVSSLIWVAPRLQADVAELKIVADLLTSKYGKPYADSCRAETVTTISAKLKHKLAIHSPPKILVEKYLMEIARSFNVDYEPDPQVMQQHDDGSGGNSLLIDLGDKNNLDGGHGGALVPPMGFIGFPQAPALPPTIPFNYPPRNPVYPSNSNTIEDNATAPPPSMPFGAPFSYNIPPKESNNFDLPNTPKGSESNVKESNVQPLPVPQPRTKVSPPDVGSLFPTLPDLPSVPAADDKTNDIDFDDLTRRFEQLKKKK